MAKVANVRQAHRFILEMDGVDQATVQTVQYPDVELGVITHGGADSDINSPGRYKYGRATITRVKPLETADNFFKEWMDKCGTELASTVKKTIILRETSPTGATVGRTLWEGAFPTKRSRSEYKRMADENVIETVEFAIDKVI